MAKPSNSQIVNPPNPLRDKVSGGGPISEEMLQRAALAVESLAEQFDDLLESEIARLHALFERAAADPSQGMEFAKQIFEIAHDLRGQAGTFDYPLITRVGTSLCRFADELGCCRERELEVIRLHIEAMQAIMASALRGDGGALGQQIADGLEKAVEKVLA